MDAGTGWRHCFPFQGGRYRDRSGRTYRQGPLRQHRVAIHPAEHDHDDYHYDYSVPNDYHNDDYPDDTSPADYDNASAYNDHNAPADDYDDHGAAAHNHYNDYN